LNLESFGGFTFIFVSCGESHFLFSWRGGDRCDMTGSDEDHGMSRRPGVEDQGGGWSSTGRVLGGWTIVRLGDAVFGLYYA
jgi:hypothetical protein